MVGLRTRLDVAFKALLIAKKHVQILHKTYTFICVNLLKSISKLKHLLCKHNLCVHLLKLLRKILHNILCNRYFYRIFCVNVTQLQTKINTCYKLVVKIFLNFLRQMDDENTKVMKYISYIGTALSLTALIVTLFTYIYL